MAERVQVTNFACNGNEEQFMPTQALYPSQLSPKVGLLATRSWQIQLAKTGPGSTYDLAEADVVWFDGNGENRVRLPIGRRW